MNAQKILAELANLPVAARMKRLTELGRDAKAADVLQGWENGDGFERRLTLQSCYGSRDGARVARMASDSSRLTRNLALTISVEVCDLSQLEQIFAPLNDKSRRHLLVLLIRKKAPRRSQRAHRRRARAQRKLANSAFVGFASVGRAPFRRSVCGGQR